MNNNIITSNGLALVPKQIDYNNFISEFSSLLNKFYSELDLNDKTIKSYNDGIISFITWLKDHRQDYEYLTKETIVDYKKHISNLLKPRTINTYLAGIRQFFNFLEDYGLPNIARGVKNLKVGNKHAKSSLTSKQYIEIEDNMLKEIEELKIKYNNKEIGLHYYLQVVRNYAIFKLAVANSLRTIEISRGNKVDIQSLNNKLVLWVQGKGHDEKDDFVVLTDETSKVLFEYLKIRGKDEHEALFISLSTNCIGERLSTRSLSKILKNIFKKYGNIDTPLITAHSTRHTGGTFLHLAKVDLRDSQVALRHKDINSTAIYTHTLERLIDPVEYKMEEYIKKERIRLYDENNCSC